MKNTIVERHDSDLYDHDKLPTSNGVRTETSLIKNQNKKIPLNTTAIATAGITSWRIPRLLLNFISVSPHMLTHAEEQLYHGLKNKYTGEYVHIRGDNAIWTVRSLCSPDNTTPIVLIHDFGCASGIWIENIDFLSRRHPIYMFDILGFGRSSRPNFDQTNSINAETKFIESIEDWRIVVGLQEKFFLIGHGFGAYLATLYTIRYGLFIKKLILLDPWGFNPRPDECQLNLTTPFWIKLLAYFTESWTSFSAFRYLGPLGLPLLKLLAPRWKRLAPVENSNKKSDTLYEYLYHVNIQPASGDVGFQALASWYGWAKEPIVQVDHSRMETISSEIPIVFIYGSRTHIDNTPAQQILHQRGSSNTSLKIIHNAAHFFFMEKPIQFHEVMIDILSDVPQGFHSLASRDDRITTTILRE
ncbi:unnamed protein product [Rotaria magnacalcarata]|uniref:AB hydrolase-1 domain-containing protein n=2 Tax=Rotaria magnacalcarata TaxID=392030 RepID=A0A815X5W5_9BILA|nr:unnamed protein product [Rotaria magnacalcarata]CAF2108585.1 unnamed protein product [Rotaria magnacalcarata]